MTDVSLSEREQECLNHLRQAEELGANLREYADAYGLKVHDLYQGKRQLTKKGVLGAAPAKAEDFVAVRVAPSPDKAVLRLRHPSGWELVCHDWPPAAWVSAIMAGNTDAA
jgi:hypothetical protein